MLKTRPDLLCAAPTPLCSMYMSYFEQLILTFLYLIITYSLLILLIYKIIKSKIHLAKILLNLHRKIL